MEAPRRTDKKRTRIARKVVEKVAKPEGTLKRRHKRKPNNRIYIHKVLRSFDANASISLKAMNTFDSIVNNVAEKISSEAVNLCRAHGRKTVNFADVHSAVKLVYSGSLYKHAAKQMQMAETKLSQSYASAPKITKKAPAKKAKKAKSGENDDEMDADESN